MPFGIDKLTHEVRLLTQKVEALAHEVARQSGQLEAVKAALLAVQKELKNMPTKADLDDAVAEVLTGVNNLGTAMLAAFTRLEAKIGQGIDATSDIASLKDLAQQVAGLTAKAAAEAADNPPPP